MTKLIQNFVTELRKLKTKHAIDLFSKKSLIFPKFQKILSAHRYESLY